MAPDFTLQAQDGREVSLHDFRGQKSVVLYFYPKDFTVGCTAEARTFGANYDRFRGLGAEVLGVSSDSTDSHMSFANECNTKFLLLSDGGGRVRDMYGVHSTLGILPGRVTFIIDRAGVVRKVFSSQTHPRRHVSEAMEALRSLEN